MTMGPSKRRSFYIFLTIFFFFFVGMLSIKLFDNDLGAFLILIPLAFGFLLAARLKCSKCGFRLSKKMPAGSLILLWIAKEKCPSCGADL
jgi:hypothetical protein